MERTNEQKLADMTKYMTDEEMYDIEGMEYQEAIEKLEAEFGTDRLDQLVAIAG